MGQNSVALQSLRGKLSVKAKQDKAFQSQLLESTKMSEALAKFLDSAHLAIAEAEGVEASDAATIADLMKKLHELTAAGDQHLAGSNLAKKRFAALV